MSIAGVRSTLGDQYQDAIALHWIVELLLNENIDYIQAESTGLPDSPEPITVDDVVVKYKVNQPASHLFIQAKLHAPKHQSWTIRSLTDELVKAEKQLRAFPESRVAFYSQSPFGEFGRLLNTCHLHPDINALRNSDEEEPLRLLLSLAEAMQCDEEKAFAFAHRIETGPHHTIEDWKRDYQRNLGRHFAKPSKVLIFIKKKLAQLTTKQEYTFKLDRENLIKCLEEEGLYPGPDINTTEAIAAFRRASSSTSHWPRDIGSKRIPRSETAELLGHVKAGKNVLVLGEPGQGKTCVLMEAVDRLAEDTNRALLFLRGDEYVHCTDRESLHAEGMPRDLENVCSRLAQQLPVAIIVDSLDVLSQSRQYGPLETILKLLDRLQRIERVSVVAACRVFDHKYDNRLSSRSWDEIITCKPLDEQVVLSLLRQWGVEPPGSGLLRLLCTPELLKCFKDLLDSGAEFRGDSRTALLEAWLENTLRKVGDRRAEVEAFLRAFTAKLLAQHRLTLPKEQLGLDPKLSLFLFSQDLIRKDGKGRVGFGHQVVQDVIHAQDLLSQGVTMKQFCQVNFQHPFIRSTLRTFLFLLRDRDGLSMCRQVREVVGDGGMAYHLKRLVCESVAEMSPGEVGAHLLRWLFRDHPTLFRFFLYRLKDPDWFAFLKQHWEPVVATHAEATGWIASFVEVSGRWLGQIPGAVFQYYTDLLAAHPEWANKLDLAMWRGLCREVSTWDTPEVRPLFEKMLELNCEKLFMGSAIAHWAKATGSGDDILWRFLIRGAEATKDNNSAFELERLLNDNWVGGFPTELIQQRMFASEDLLSRALDFLVQWSANHTNEWKGRLQDHFLHYTAWEERHTRGDQHLSSLHHLCAAIAEALRRHAGDDSTWWRAKEPILRHCPEEGVRFMLLEAYNANIPANIPGISAQLTDPHYLRYSHLSDELGHLLNKSAPLLSPENLEACQQAILSLFAEEGEVDWVITSRANLLSWIPANYRLPETTALLDSRRKAWGAPRPSPSINSYFGLVGSPISCEIMETLSDASIIRLLCHYECDEWGKHEDGRLVGGRTTLSRIFSQAVANSPIRFMALMPSMRAACVHLDYELAVISGSGDHLSRRRGKLQSSEEWKPVQPLPDEQEVASRLLTLIRNTPTTSETANTLCRTIEPCASTLRNAVEKWMVLLQIEKLWKFEMEFSVPRDGTNDILHAADYLVGGLFALWKGWLESDALMPGRLERMLQECAASRDLGARVHLLHQLPYLLYKSPGLGWELLGLALNDAPGHLFKHAERCFYYNYLRHFKRIAPYLIRIFEQHLDVAGETWGRIIILSLLSGHVTWEEIRTRLAAAPELAWKGAADVFCRNIASQQSTDLCLDGLRFMLASSYAVSLHGRIDKAFGEDESASHIPADIVLQYISDAPLDHGHFDGFRFLPWLALKAADNPLEAVPLLEALAAKCLDSGATLSYKAENALSALRSLYYEAEESLDPDLLRRSLDLMDAFQKIEVTGIDSFFNELAGREE